MAQPYNSTQMLKELREINVEPSFMYEANVIDDFNQYIVRPIAQEDRDAFMTILSNPKNNYIRKQYMWRK